MAIVLLVEDNDVMRGTFAHELVSLGHETRTADTLATAEEVVAIDDPDVVLLDLSLPDAFGTMSILRRIREATDVPIVAMALCSDSPEVLASLSEHVDGVLLKPFSAAEMAMSLRRVLGTHTAVMSRSLINVGQLRVDDPARTAELDGRVLALRKLEFDVLSYLAHHAGRIVSRHELSRAVWGLPLSTTRHSMYAHVSKLRSKLGECSMTPQYLHTVRGIGLRLSAPDGRRTPTPLSCPEVLAR